MQCQEYPSHYVDSLYYAFLGAILNPVDCITHTDNMYQVNYSTFCLDQKNGIYKRISSWLTLQGKSILVQVSCMVWLVFGQLKEASLQISSMSLQPSERALTKRACRGQTRFRIVYGPDSQHGSQQPQEVAKEPSSFPSVNLCPKTLNRATFIWPFDQGQDFRLGSQRIRGVN